MTFSLPLISGEQDFGEILSRYPEVSEIKKSLLGVTQSLSSYIESNISLILWAWGKYANSVKYTTFKCSPRKEFLIEKVIAVFKFIGLSVYMHLDM